MPVYYLNITTVKEALNGRASPAAIRPGTPAGLGDELCRITRSIDLSPEDLSNPEIIAKLYRALSNLSKKSPIREAVLSKIPTGHFDDILAEININIASPLPIITFTSNGAAHSQHVEREANSFAFYQVLRPEAARAVQAERRAIRRGDDGEHFRWT